MGKVSKIILSRVVSSLRSKTSLVQWINSSSTIQWFKDLVAKDTLTFIQFDIIEFYPNITEKLLKGALQFAQSKVDLNDEECDLILKTKEAILFKAGRPWIKRGGKPFNVTMGSWDGAEVADLVGLYLLSKLAVLGLNVGLYRDDGLAAVKLRPRLAELAKKKICRIFKEHGLSITATANLKSVNFLDVNFNLESGLYRPYIKPNDKPSYVHKDSNHPKSILRNIPLAVNRRLSSISANEEVFNAAIPSYQEALEKSGYNHQLKYEPVESKGRSKNRPRKIIWFNPPYSCNVQTNIGAKF